MSENIPLLSSDGKVSAYEVNQIDPRQ